MQRIAVSSSFSAADEAVFENGLDLVSRPGALEGPWRQQWEDDFEHRVQRADALAEVAVRTVRTDVDLADHETFRLAVAVIRKLVERPLPDDLELVAQEGVAGFASVKQHRRLLLDRRFYLFVKWVEAADGRIRPRWHLAPVSNEMTSRLRQRVRQRDDAVPEPEPTGARRRVILRSR